MLLMLVSNYGCLVDRVAVQVWLPHLIYYIYGLFFRKAQKVKFFSGSSRISLFPHFTHHLLMQFLSFVCLTKREGKRIAI